MWTLVSIYAFFFSVEYYVLVHGYSSFRGVSLKATLIVNTVHQLSNGILWNVPDSTKRMFIAYLCLNRNTYHLHLTCTFAIRPFLSNHTNKQMGFIFN